MRQCHTGQRGDRGRGQGREVSLHMVRRVGSRSPGQPVRQGAQFPGTLPAPLPLSLPPPPRQDGRRRLPAVSTPLDPSIPPAHSLPTSAAPLRSPRGALAGGTQILTEPQAHLPNVTFRRSALSRRCPLPFPGIPLASEPGPTGPFPPRVPDLAQGNAGLQSAGGPAPKPRDAGR